MRGLGSHGHRPRNTRSVGSNAGVLLKLQPDTYWHVVLVMSILHHYFNFLSLSCTVFTPYYLLHHFPTQGRASPSTSNLNSPKQTTLGACCAATLRPQRTHNLFNPSKTRRTEPTYHYEPFPPAPNTSVPIQLRLITAIRGPHPPNG